MPFVGESYSVRGEISNMWTVSEPLDYQGKEECFTVPVGFRTDFTTVPRIVSWLFPKFGLYSRAAILHDYLCVEAHSGRFSRADADGIFRRVLREHCISFPRRWMMWGGVRAASGLRGASFKEVVQFLAVALFAVPFLLIPIVVLCLWIFLIWLIELPWKGFA